MLNNYLANFKTQPDIIIISETMPLHTNAKLSRILNWKDIISVVKALLES